MSAILDESKNKDSNMVEVSSEWFKGLLKHAKMTENAIDKDNEVELKLWLKINGPGLLGFIDSAKYIIEDK